MTELILYAVPTGDLAAAVGRYFAAVTDHPTTAQAFPPHCTLTGFFHDVADSIPAYVHAASAAAAAADVEVEVVALRVAEDWIGLELESPDLRAIAADFARRVSDVPTRADDVRVKDWMHLSLAYGHDPTDQPRLADLAAELVDPTAVAGWTLRLLSRRADGWTVHGDWPLAP